MLTAQVKKDYGSFKLQDIKVKLKQGQLFGCLGPNGSGKSTLVKILTGQIQPTSGTVSVLGIDVVRNPVDARKVMGIIPEQESPPSFLTVHEYLQFICKVREVGNEKIDEWLSFFDFSHERDMLIKDLSRGTKQKVVATQAFIHSPRMVFIDEPLINLDPVMQKKFKKFLVDYAKKNTIFLSTHILSIASEVCTDVGILKDGKLVLQDTMRNIRKGKKNLEDFFIGAIDG
ncbi:MAG: ABC transporter ATP-binding protein [Candidatus Woesearchaeota archaeon]